ncbi:MAG TPA: FtsX-like permease family protein, partial [Chryseolinea sp.]
QDKLESFKQEVLKNNQIQSATITGYVPVNGGWRNDNSFWPKGNQPTESNMVGLQAWNVDFDYVKTMGMKIVKGRDFSTQFLSDSGAVILNQVAVERFNLGDDPIGKEIATFDLDNGEGTPDPNKVISRRVIGVVENFHFESMRDNIAPLGLFIGSAPGSVIFRFEAKNAQDVIKTTEKTWKMLAPSQPFQYSFLDQNFERMYAAEQRLGETFGVFAGLAIVIACLGLFALTAFTAEQRTKEIGIRKVLGASVSSIVLLLSREFGKLVIIAFVLAAPLAWFAVNWWLTSYSYKVEIGIGMYLLAGACSFLIAWLTMGYQSIKAARSNPVTSLRSE